MQPLVRDWAGSSSPRPLVVPDLGSQWALLLPTALEALGPHPTPQHTAASPHVSTPREILALARVCTHTANKPTGAGTSGHMSAHQPTREG